MFPIAFMESLNSGSSSARAGPGQKKGSTYTPGSSFSIKVAKPKKAAESAASWGTDPKLNPPLDAAEAALCRLKQLKRAIRVGTIGQKDRARSGNYPMSSSRTYGHTMDQKRQASKVRQHHIVWPSRVCAGVGTHGVEFQSVCHNRRAIARFLSSEALHR